MCRNIKPLFNYDPIATDDDVRAAALQFVRKISGYNKPSKANEEVFDAAVMQVAIAAQTLLDGLTTKAPPRSRADEIAKKKAQNAKRFGTS